MFRLLVTLIFFFSCDISILHAATRIYSKDWAVANIIAPLAEDSSFKYYLEPQIRLIDTHYVFNQFLILGGLGYQFNPDLMFFIGPGWISVKTPNNTNFSEQRLWQQLNWRIYNQDKLTLDSRSRLEERTHTNHSQTAFRLRQRFWLRVPLKWNSYYFSTYDELFFNLNHPIWTSPYSFEQNRGFVGIGKQLTQSAILDVGYMNQYIHSRINQSDNVVLLSLTMIT